MASNCRARLLLAVARRMLRLLISASWASVLPAGGDIVVMEIVDE